MGEAREVAERFYESFAAGDFKTVTGYFAEGCVTITPAGSFDVAQHEAFGRAFKKALPDAHMQVVRAVEDGNEGSRHRALQGNAHGRSGHAAGDHPSVGQSAGRALRRLLPGGGRQDRRARGRWDQMAMMSQLGAGPVQ